MFVLQLHRLAQARGGGGGEDAVNEPTKPELVEQRVDALWKEFFIIMEHAKLAARLSRVRMARITGIIAELQVLGFDAKSTAPERKQEPVVACAKCGFPRTHSCHSNKRGRSRAGTHVFQEQP
jgi:hypothetical protein